MEKDFINSLKIAVNVMTECGTTYLRATTSLVPARGLSTWF